MGWEMAVGFRRLNQLQVWDGRRWSQEDMPGSKRTSPPSGRPRGPSAQSGPHANGTSAPAAHSDAGAAAGSNGAGLATRASNGSAAGPAATAAAPLAQVPADAAASSAASQGTVRKPWEAARSAPRPAPGADGGSDQQPAVAAAAAGTANSSPPAKGSAKDQSAAIGASDAKADVPAMVAQPLLECHYSLHGAFLSEPLLEVRWVGLGGNAVICCCQSSGATNLGDSCSDNLLLSAPCIPGW